MAKTVVIYHGNCMDGFTAAWVIKKWWDAAEAKMETMINLGAIQVAEDREPDEIEFIAGVYQKPVPLEKLRGNNVIIVDFSYKLPEMEQIASVARALTWIDHHKSAMLDMNLWVLGHAPSNVAYYTDLERSGAGLAWDFYFQLEQRPLLVNHVEARDLWNFTHPDTRNFNAFMFSHEYDFGLWDELAEKAEDPAMLAVMCAAGAAIERKHFKDINELLPICTRHIQIAGHIVPCANLPYTMVSDAGNILANRNPSLFGICYYDGMDGRNFSLRSVDGGMDVSEIAQLYGGGGHAKSAGFKVPMKDVGQFEIDYIPVNL